MDRSTDETRRDLAAELESELHFARGEADRMCYAVAILVLLVAMLAVALAGQYIDNNFRAHVAAYEVANRCVRECDCLHTGLDR